MGRLKVYMEEWGFRIVPLEDEGSNEQGYWGIEDEINEIFDSLDFNEEDDYKE